MKPIYEDNELIIDLINDNEEAFCSLYAKYRRRIFHFILTFIKSPDIAEDICQDVFTLIWKNRKFLDPNASFQSYLYTISRNRTLNFIRDNTQKQMLDDIILAEAVDSGEDIFEQIAADELDNILQQAINSLTDRQKKIFTLSRKQGLSHQEIAKALGLSPNTVNEHITNALRSIQNHLSKHYNVYTVFFLLSQLNS
ncbi:RNA polymerase sigma-70 factor [Dysgonomonas sp. BGC7]|uniref:RNA polymerase sigma-70 factor n=1 Tax=Dysgonomonas sp. BGC7 TaxID=1658008 RepID=UPI00068315EA|nr:RNA polymerase sigma-70 factor [Dysgonomonas sp. BGC7]MBD8388582.1 RNA polymerase sigma-70 factor [Dysgonomonas sp. BGC7]